MPALRETLEAINETYGQLDGVSLPSIDESMSVGAYLAAIDTLNSFALHKADEAIELAIEAGRYVDTQAQLVILRGIREQLVEMHATIHANLDGFSSALTLAQAWETLQGGGGGNPGNGDSGTSFPPDDAVVIYGDTPLLLRSGDDAVPAEAVFRAGASGAVMTSPEISIESSGSWRIGTLSGTGAQSAAEVIKDATVGAVKGLLGEVVAGSGSATLGLSFQAWEAYELGKTLSTKTDTAIDFISSGLLVLQGRKSYAEWNSEHDAFMNQTKQELDAMAASTLVSKVPVVGWVLSPVVDAYSKLSFKLQNTNSFEISVTRAGATGIGARGGIILGGSQNEQLAAGDGSSLVAGGAGDDRIIAGHGTQYLFGDSGRDTVVFATSRGGQTMSHSGAALLITGTLGSHILQGVERIEFADHKFAFDLEGGAAAANAARLLGAGLDRSGLTPQLVGMALAQFDQGFSMLQVAEIALASPQILGIPGLTNGVFVDTVYLNVVGRAPSTAEHDYFTGLLVGSGGAMSRAELLVLAANTPVNAVNIDLVGLQQSGLEYL